MGKQICFFANEVDLKEMFKIVALDEIVLLNKTGEIVTIEDFFSCIDSYFQKDNQLTQTWYLSCSDSKIEYIISGDYRCVNPLKSDVIEFHHCTKIPSKILDTSSVNNMFLKNGFIVIDDTDKYNSLMEELRRNPKYINNPHYKKNGFEHGRFWCNDSICDDKRNKLFRKFNQIKRYISKNYILSKQKYAYIGPHAFDDLKNGNFIPCSGKNIVEY